MSEKKLRYEVIEILSDDDDEMQQETAAQNRCIKSSIRDKGQSKKQKVAPNFWPRQAGLVLDEDIDDRDNNEGITIESYSQAQHSLIEQGKPAILFEDVDFPTLPRSIQGPKRDQKTVTCRCKGSPPAKLDYKLRNDTLHPFYRCAKKRCMYYSNAFQAERLHWYRFGSHSGHAVVAPTGFSANDLCQGRVGDCWFLSALAVVAERPDLIHRLFGKFMQLNEFGICQVNLFLDGYWKTVIIDNFLPCLIDDQGEAQLRRAIQASMGVATAGRGTSMNGVKNHDSSNHNPRAISDQCQKVLRDTREYLEQDIAQNRGLVGANVAVTTQAIERQVTSDDLAYSKAKHNQLWVPLLEKAYAKSHGSYQAISGGHIAEAFLDLTGAPTLVYRFDSADFKPREFWDQLMKFRKQRLPMGCATDQSQVGIIGMHAYSILDVVEVHNVDFGFFQETGVAHGNVSGFTEFDGRVRLLQIRNPHGKSEWKGDFSDHSDVWEKLVKYQCAAGPRTSTRVNVAAHAEDEQQVASKLERTMRNDGKFWIDYDSFLMGYSNVDVVLAFMGNHAKSFSSNFPAKKSNQRCMRAFEVSLLDAQEQQGTSDTVELYIMGIQRTRRGAGHGRADRKVSYKVCDLGILVGEWQEDLSHDVFAEDHLHDSDFWRNLPISSVQGQMFGFQRNGHYRIVLDRKRHKSLVVIPISFGHPSATDKELSFVLRFVSDAPLVIRETPAVPRLDTLIQKFCLSPSSTLGSKQGIQKVLLQGSSYRLIEINCVGNGGGTVFLYLCVDDTTLARNQQMSAGLSLSVEVRCRGMSCRTEEGLLQHETIVKGKKFEAAWRKYKSEFLFETQSRLLAVLYQSGQDYQFGGIVCREVSPIKPKARRKNILEEFLSDKARQTEEYVNRGIFNGVVGKAAFEMSSNLRSELSQGNHTSSVDSSHGTDWELEQILAISREDIELQHAIEMSRNDISAAPDTMDVNELIVADTATNSILQRVGLDTTVTACTMLGRGTSSIEENNFKWNTFMSSADSKPAAVPNKAQQDEVLDLTEDFNEVTGILKTGSKQGDLNIREKRQLVAEAALRRMAKKK